MTFANKRKFAGETFVLRVIRNKKSEANKWAQSARKRPHYARCRVVKSKSAQRGIEYGVYCHGVRKGRKKK